MFVGRFEYTIDDKGRLTIPAKFRPELAGGLVVTRGIDRCLSIYPLSAWEPLARKVSALPMTDRSARAFRRLVFADACDTVPDQQGRVLIPPYLREYADLDGNVVITGLSDHLEVWSRMNWDSERQHVEGKDGNAEEWGNLGI